MKRTGVGETAGRYREIKYLFIIFLRWSLDEIEVTLLQGEGEDRDGCGKFRAKNRVKLCFCRLQEVCLHTCNLLQFVVKYRGEKLTCYRSGITVASIGVPIASFLKYFLHSLVFRGADINTSTCNYLQPWQTIIISLPSSQAQTGILSLFHSLLTTTNTTISGLGLSLAHRLLDEFITVHPPTHHLTLIITTRSASKGAATLSALTNHLVSVLPPSATKRIALAHYQVDLTNLNSVSALAKALIRNYRKLDYVFLNAGMGAFLGIDWINCFITLFTNWIPAVTFPTFKLQAIGWKTAQPPATGEIGSVFCANVFGHYYLTHELMGLLSAGKGRIIWTSSLEAYPWTFTPDDIEAIKATHSYESTRRLTDIISLTSSLPATAPYAATFFGTAGKRPKTYLTHPGVCATAIVPLNIMLFYCMTLAFYIARWLGSPWHTVNSYSGAKAGVWIAMATDEELEDKEADRVKWGSGTDRLGNELVKETEVEGEEEEGWEALGRECWRQMEELRMEWKKKVESN